MRIFISWSGERSGTVARALQSWIPKVIQVVRPWISSASIDPGARWNAEMSQALQDLQFGVLCLTPENLPAPWVLFEAGALSKTVTESRVVPYLLNFDARELQGPLAQFQAVQADRAGTYQLLAAINAAAVDQAIPTDGLSESFELWWPRLEPTLRQVAAAVPSEAPPPARSAEDMIGEVLTLLRTQRLSPAPVETEPNLAILQPTALEGQSLGYRVRALRTGRGLSQNDLAIQIGASQGYISQIETGRFYPTSWAIAALARVLGVTAEELTAPGPSAG